MEGLQEGFSTDTTLLRYSWLVSIHIRKASSVLFCQIKCIYVALLTSADISKRCTETQPKTPISKQCSGSTVARKNSLERPNPRKKPREEPGYEGWPVLF
jgi:hypothetical protein